MPIQAKITHLPLESIVLDRENRQRTDITNESVLDLAISIGQSQWISPLLVEIETNKLMAGERRLTAVKLLRSVNNGTTKGELAEALKDVSAVLPACLGSLEQNTSPARF